MSPGEWAAHKARYGHPGETMADFRARAECKAREKGYDTRRGDFYKPGSSVAVWPFYGGVIPRTGAAKTPAKKATGSRTPATRKAPVKKAHAAALRSVEDEVRRAYLAIAHRYGEFVSLADLREKLHGIPRGALDRVLIDMDRSPEVHVLPVANRRSLTPRDNAAALRMGGQDQNAILIDGAR